MKKVPYTVPEEKKIRVIIDTDAYCECDDQYAIVHAILSGKVEVCGIVASHFGVLFDPDSMEHSYEEAIKTLKYLEKDEINVYRGVNNPLISEEDYLEAQGVEFIINEALKNDDRPLFIITQGPFSNLASALLKEKSIEEKAICICIAGKNYPVGGFDFNTMNDHHAFNVVMNSKMPVWAVPEEVYSTLQIGFIELIEKVYPYGKIGKYLVENTFSVSENMNKKVGKMPWQNAHEYSIGFPNGESWSLGDSAGIGILLSSNSGSFTIVKAPNVNREGLYFFKPDAKEIRWYNQLNTRFILEDFFSKIKYFYNE